MLHLPLFLGTKLRPVGTIEGGAPITSSSRPYPRMVSFQKIPSHTIICIDVNPGFSGLLFGGAELIETHDGQN